ncbi:MAG: hypothetical protein II336_17520 [Loktanella sp.]|nr:hypothetical protein [Loktanella sp.]
MNRRSFFALLATTALISPQAALADDCQFQNFANDLRRDLGAQVLRGVGYAGLTVAAMISVAVALPVAAGIAGAVVSAAATGTAAAPMLAFVGIIGLRGFAPAMRRLGNSLGDQLDSQMGAFNVQYN